MSLTLGAAIKATLESFALGVPAHTRLPTGQKHPYILIHDAIANADDKRFGSRTSGSKPGAISDVQLDVLQDALGPADAAGKRIRVYDPLLPELVAARLRSADLSTHGTPGRIWGIAAVNGPMELPAPLATNVIHHVITMQVRRDLPLARP